MARTISGVVVASWWTVCCVPRVAWAVQALSSARQEPELLSEASDLAAYEEATPVSEGTVVMYGPTRTSADISTNATEVATEEGVSSHRFNCDTDYLLLFTLGKTGTTTFHESMQKLCGFGAPYVPEKRKTYPQGIKPQQYYDVAKDFLKKVNKGHRVWVVSGVRNPFERTMSKFFQKYGDTLKNAKVAIDQYRGQCLHLPGCHDGEEFFENFEQVTGVTLKKLANQFNHDKKISLVKTWYKKNIRMYTVALRMEDIASWPRSLDYYFPGFSLVPANEASEKNYAKVYKQFKAAFQYSQDEVQCLLNSPTLKFYKSSEVKSMVHAPYFEDIKVKLGGDIISQIGSRP